MTPEDNHDNDDNKTGNDSTGITHVHLGGSSLVIFWQEMICLDSLGGGIMACSKDPRQVLCQTQDDIRLRRAALAKEVVLNHLFDVEFRVL